MFVTHHDWKDDDYQVEYTNCRRFSAVGRLSATAALAILSAFGSQTATLPTEILSTQTEGFGRPTTLTTDGF